MTDVSIPYSPRPLWKNEIHPALNKFRFAVLVCHRRFGKTVGSLNEMIRQAVKNKKRMPQLAYIAPYRNQAKRIAWEYLKYYTAPIPGRIINEADLFVELPSAHKNSPGARIYIIGADHPDALRGLYLDMAVLDEYAQIKPELWDEVLLPALADRKGKALFIGTPKGQNQFYERYLSAVKDPEWYTCLYTAEESGILDEEELRRLKADMSETAYQQEMMCDFTVSATNIVIPIQLVDEAVKREIAPREVSEQPVIIGVDVARFGDDSTTIWRRQGLWVDKPLIYKGLNTMEVADRVIEAMRQWNADAVFIDVGGLGAGVVDRIRQLGYQNISDINFGNQALNPERYVNIRAEMYFKARDFLQGGGSLPDVPALKQELTVTEYSYNPSGKIQLCKKEDIKEKLGRSPDLADGFVLTFARPVAPKFNRYSAGWGANKEYDPLGDM